MLYHWQAQGLEMFVHADDAVTAHRAVIAKLSAHCWKNPARYKLAMADLAGQPPFTEAYPCQVVLLDCGTWTAPKAKNA